MKNVAFIPARAGSKGIPGKAWKLLNGKPLCYYAIEAAINCDFIDTIVISTDSDEVENVAIDLSFEMPNSKKLQFYARNPKHYEDKAPLDPILVDYAIENNFETLCLLQVTNPFTSARILNNAYAEFTKGLDSMLSVVEQNRFYWKYSYRYVSYPAVERTAYPLNYLPASRPNRDQMFENNLYVENGAFYIVKHEVLLKEKCRVSRDDVGLYVMPQYSLFELDEEPDWLIVEKLMELKELPEFQHFTRLVKEDEIKKKEEN